METSSSTEKQKRRIQRAVSHQREITRGRSMRMGFWMVISWCLPLCISAQTEILEQVPGASSAAHDVVLGSDGKQMILLRQPTDELLIGNRSNTFVAAIQGGPKSVSPPKSVALVPEQHKAWEALGRLLHVDIDPASEMAVLSVESGGRYSVWFSGKKKDGSWSNPWPVPAIKASGGQAIFAMFDVHSGREGDVLCGYKPSLDSAGFQNERKGKWKGGYDIVRVPRRGGHNALWFLDAVNTTADEWALAPHPVRGGWLSAERLKGLGGVDAWWCADVPLDEATLTHAGEFLEGHTLTVLCGVEPIGGVQWTIQDAKTGSVLTQFSTDSLGVAKMSALRRDGHFLWTAAPVAGCGQALAIWKDANGEVVHRFALMGESWQLNMLAAMAVGTWRVQPLDRSGLPRLSPLHSTGVKADWVVFHAVGSPLLPSKDLRLLKAWAIEWASAKSANDQVLVMGHASADGDPEANRILAKERARQVAVQLEFAGLAPEQIRVEGWGADRPLLRCPPGLNCPKGERQRSRRTELYLLSE